MTDETSLAEQLARAVYDRDRYKQELDHAVLLAQRAVAEGREEDGEAEEAPLLSLIVELSGQRDSLRQSMFAAGPHAALQAVRSAALGALGHDSSPLSTLMLVQDLAARTRYKREEARDRGAGRSEEQDRAQRDDHRVVLRAADTLWDGVARAIHALTGEKSDPSWTAHETVLALEKAVEAVRLRGH